MKRISRRLTGVQTAVASAARSNACVYAPACTHTHRSYSILPQISGHGDRIALVDRNGKHTYSQLLTTSRSLANSLLPLRRVDDKQPRIAFWCPRDASYVCAQWATWLTGAIAVPLSDAYPAQELEYFFHDSAPSVAIVHSSMEAAVSPLLADLRVPIVRADAPVAHSGHTADTLAAGGDARQDGAMIVYTSGTTSKPKGVLVTHPNLRAQINALTTAWAWSADDRILHVLPLHHVHGIMAVLLCSLWSGATCEMLPKFDAAATWRALVRPKDHRDALTVFMAVPTVYAKLIEYYGTQPESVQRQWSDVLRHHSAIRLMVSGSAALPEPILRRWQSISGHFLLERFGMSEFGMALSNSYRGPRIANSVGKPLPGYEARVVNETNPSLVYPTGSGQTGELQIRGPAVFREYWNKPGPTAESFTADGWFHTGDAVHQDADGNFYIQGRLSADIIKSGGYKLSALEIERVLLDHPDILEIAVVGAPDVTYGERVAAVVALRNPDDSASSTTDSREAAVLTQIREWAADKLAHYKLPTVVRVVSEIPRNAMGKVNKKELRARMFPPVSAAR